ncbi:Phosphotransferase enzyme family protein [Cnuella takakiae]|uniref:Phosphotransferase enzyme family protein n=1 Tax=Cnuella takakiae TaxID=1302690 RepID=A0A1M4WXX7_9BACT|nr:aminoglycoside phosphotransferase family protein [Cnuella takakiae]OLY91594.1 aminoglycoside phosphotransferase [Cnuella takakiae]SHE85822.1 Phosphotransferase enzyme family protein [Cnuella takakiae]
MEIGQVLAAYGIEEATASVSPFGSGLINYSWKVQQGDAVFLLQKINHFVFQQPWDIAHNISAIGQYLGKYHPEYLFVAALPALNGRPMVHLPEAGYFRLFPFLQQAHAFDVVATPEQAYEAAVQFGRFTRMLAHFDATRLKPTIPHFHNLPLRFLQFEHAVQEGNPERKQLAARTLAELFDLRHLVRRYEAIAANADFRIRVIHHDTKISNVLFDGRDKGLCVIDLDTVMPGYFISDVGDMMRTYLSPVSEEEQDFSSIEVRLPFYEAIVSGYLQEMQAELSEAECAAFFYAGQFMIYMQALRFITDYLNNDVYYGQRYPGHNLVRAQNQLVLLQRLMEKEPLLCRYQGVRKSA